MMSMKQAIDILFENTATDTIYEAINAQDFYEFHVNEGGDSVVYRVYKKDGHITIK